MAITDKAASLPVKHIKYLSGKLTHVGTVMPYITFEALNIIG